MYIYSYLPSSVLSPLIVVEWEYEVIVGGTPPGVAPAVDAAVSLIINEGC